MLMSDFVEVARLLNRKTTELEIRIANFENHFNTFRKFDELDAVELHKLLVEKEYLDELQVDILKLCDYLLKYNKG